MAVAGARIRTQYRSWSSISARAVHPFDANVIKQALRDTGKGVNAVAKASGVPQGSLQRFLSGHRNLNLANAERLCAYLGLELAQVGRERGARTATR
jgi:hypothetical protein